MIGADGHGDGEGPHERVERRWTDAALFRRFLARQQQRHLTSPRPGRGCGRAGSCGAVRCVRHGPQQYGRLSAHDP